MVGFRALGGHPAGHDAHDEHVLGHQLRRDDVGEPVERPLAGEISRRPQGGDGHAGAGGRDATGGVARVVLDAGDRVRFLHQPVRFRAAGGDVDDPPAAARLHARHRQLGEGERRVQVDREVVQPVRPRHLQQRRRPVVADGHGRVVDEDVDAAEAVGRGGDDLLQVPLVRQVGGDRDRLAAHGLDLLDRLPDGAGQLAAGRLDRAGGHHQARAAPGQRQRRPLADAAA